MGGNEASSVEESLRTYNIAIENTMLLLNIHLIYLTYNYIRINSNVYGVANVASNTVQVEIISSPAY